MKKSAIPLFVLILLASLSLTLLPVVQSQTVAVDDIKVLSYSWYVNGDGVLIMVGEIQNVGSTTIGPEVILYGKILTSDGTYAESANRALVLNLIPQQKAPFYMQFYNPTTQYGLWYAYPDLTNVQIKAYEPQATTKYNYPDLQITDHSNTIDSDGTYWVSGHVKNTGTQTATNITIIATFYNTEGTAIAFGFTEFLTPTSLGPQQTTAFKVGAFDLDQDIVPDNKKIHNYSLLIQVIDPVLQGEPPANQPTLPPSSPPTTEPTQTSSTDSTPSQLPTWVYVVVAAIAIVLIIGAILLVKKRKSPQPQTTKSSSKITQNPTKKRKP